MSEPSLKYPWQQAIIDAFMEFRPEHLQLKINVAERAIQRRLSDSNPIDTEEHIAIQDALRSLRILLSQDGKPEEEPGEKKERA